MEHPNRPNWFEDYHHKLIAGACAPAVFAVPDFLRRLTLKEAVAIQICPLVYRFCGSRTKQYRQIGNAVPALFAYKAAQAARSDFF